MRSRSHPPFLRGLLAALALAGALLLMSGASARADDGSVWVFGGDVYPLTDSDIRMESETVQAICYRGFAEYLAEFMFVNAGETKQVQLGFPCSPYGGDHDSLVAFRAWQDGRPLEVTLGEGPDPTRPGFSIAYYLHEATFPHGETMIRVSYLSGSSWMGGGRFSSEAPASLGPWGDACQYEYWLHTGAGWRDTIGKAAICYSLADDFDGSAVDVKAAEIVGFEEAGRTTGPESYAKLDDRTYQWVFEDLEPTTIDDIVLAFTGSASRREVDAAASDRLDDATDLRAGWQVFDGSLQSAWGVPAPATGGWVKLSVEGSLGLQEIRILPGRNDRLGSFTEYGRPKTLEVTLSDGTSAVLTLEDEPCLQRFAVSGETEWVRFDILDVYPGSTSDDTYISEVSLGTEPAPRFETFSGLIAAEAPPVAGPVAGPVASTPTTVLVASATTLGGGGPAGNDSGRTFWLAVLGAVVAAAGLVVLVYLAARLRRIRSS